MPHSMQSGLAAHRKRATAAPPDTATATAHSTLLPLQPTHRLLPRVVCARQKVQLVPEQGAHGVCLAGGGLLQEEPHQRWQLLEVSIDQLHEHEGDHKMLQGGGSGRELGWGVGWCWHWVVADTGCACWVPPPPSAHEWPNHASPAHAPGRLHYRLPLMALPWPRSVAIAS